MGPRKMMGTKPPRKGKEKASGSTNEPPLFRDDDAANRWPLFQNRGYVTGRFMHTMDFERYNIKGLFTRIQWQGILEIDELVYPYLMRLFYCNLTIEDDEISSIVKGVKINFTSEDFADMVGITNSGNEIYFWNDNPDLDDIGLSKAQIYGRICEDYREGMGVVTMSLHPTARLINLILTDNVFQKAGDKGKMNLMQCLGVYSILEGRPLALGHIICNHMAEIPHKRRNNLPYGMLLTRIFKYFDIPLNNEASVKPSAPFTYSTIDRMDLDGKKKKDPKKRKTQEGEEEDAGAETAEEEDLSKPATMGSIRALEKRMEEQYTHLEYQLNDQASKLDFLVDYLTNQRL